MVKKNKGAVIPAFAGMTVLLKIKSLNVRIPYKDLLEGNLA